MGSSGQEETTMKRSRNVLMLLASGLLVSLGLSTAAAAPAGALPALPISSVGFCANGGTVQPGTYRAMEIRNFCFLTDSGTVNILGNLVIDRGAVFDAVTNGDIVVGGSVEVRPGAALGLGCNKDSVGPPCLGSTSDEVVGSIIANKALAVIVHSTTVIGNFTLSGGGGGSTSCSTTHFMGGPPFSTFEDGSVGGNLSITGMTTCWMGIFRTTVGGNVNVSDNLTNTKDPDAPEINDNTIAGSLSCFANVPPATLGHDHPPQPKSTAAGGKFGQCADL
jgi:hypothetical protein